MMSLAQHGLRVLGGLAILLGWTTPPAVAARDPAPMVDGRRQAVAEARAQLSALQEDAVWGLPAPSPGIVPTLTQDRPAAPPPDPATASTPAYLSRRRPVGLYAFAGPVLLAAAPPTPS